MIRIKIARHDIAAISIIFFIALFLYFPVLMPGRVLLPTDLLLLTPPWSAGSEQLAPGFTHVLRPAWDPLFQFYPARKYLAESLCRGAIPLWNPHAFAGTPFAADGQSAVFYPVNWLFALLPLGFAFGAVAFLHSFLTGVFFYLYGRRVGWSVCGTVGGAIVWMLCGIQVGWQMWQVVDSTICWLPLCLYFWEGYRQSPKSGHDIGLCIAIAMTILAGHLQFAFYVLLTVVTYALYRPVESSIRGQLNSLLRLLGTIVMGIALSGVQILATTEFLHLSIRIALPMSKLLPSALAPAQLGLLVMPGLFGGERDYLNHPFLAGEYYEKVIYCGASALVFAAFALRLRRPQDLSRYWLGLGVLSLLIACGSPLYALFYYAVPLYKSFHGLSRACVLFDFSVAALAAQGITLLGSEDQTSRKRAAQASGGLIGLFVVGSYRIGVLGNGRAIAAMLTHPWLTYGMLQVLLSLCLVLAAYSILLKLPVKVSWVATVLVAADMLIFASGLNPGGSSSLLYPATSETTFVSQQLARSPLDRVLCLGDGTHPQSRIIPNGPMALDWNDVSGSNPLILKNYNSYITRVNMADTGLPEPSGQGMIANPGNPGLNEMNVKWIASPSVLTLPNYRLADTGAINIYENMSAQGPAWMESATPKAQGSFTQPPPAVVLSKESALTVNVTAASSGRLVVSQAYCPGWTATVDGRPAQVSSSDGLLPAIDLLPGHHKVQLKYRPDSVRIGLYVTCIGWMLVAILAVKQRISH